MLKSLALGGTAFIFLVGTGIGFIGRSDQRPSIRLPAPRASVRPALQPPVPPPGLQFPGLAAAPTELARRWPV